MESADNIGGTGNRGEYEGTGNRTVRAEDRREWKKPSRGIRKGITKTEGKIWWLTEDSLSGPS